ncbi:MAG: aspartyl/asparaginyl beta-hydroxylase domain-containing protein [Hyphomicrobiales bacterium]
MARSKAKTISRTIKGVVLGALVLGAGLFFVPLLVVFYLITGLLDVMRNKRRDALVFQRYFLGNGIPTWMLSPFNLLVDLFCFRNKGVYQLDDLPPEWRAEVESVLDVFRSRKDEIIAEVDRAFETGRRGMFVYTWYGKENPHEVEEFKREFRYVKTIAVSVFSGKESTKFHYGPLRLTLRVLYNLTPVETDKVYIQCGWEKHYWHENPLYIFDDTLIHRSVNEYDARRYAVFMDIMRPTPYPKLLAAVISGVSVIVARFNTIFYKNWKMLRPGATQPSKA